MGWTTFIRVLSTCLVIATACGLVYAQVTTTGRLSGIVKDSQGAVIPGAEITVKHDQIGTEYRAIANEVGSWTVPSVPNGSYTVTVTAQGFKTAVTQNVKVDSSSTATVNTTLEIGGIAEKIVVTGGGSIVQTESTAISSTIVGRQIGELPWATRDALQLVLTLPGVQTPGTPRTSSVNGLPKSSLNITLDGANIQDNFLKSSDGFFTSIQAKSDAVEEVTVSTATPGAESAGEGAIQVKFVTKSGSNDLRGGVFWQHRNTALNSNYFFNNIDGLPRDHLILNQWGGNMGGPISIPGLFDGKDRAFFFVNFEEFKLPQTYAGSRTVLAENARRGIFRYRDSGGVVRDVDLLAIASAGNSRLPAGTRAFATTIDSKIDAGLKLVDDAARKGSLRSRIETNNDYNLLNLNFQDPGRNLRRFPTGRLDFNINKNHHLEFVHNFQHYFSDPDGVNGQINQYPGSGIVVGHPGLTGSIYRNASSFVMAHRWTVSNRIVNELRLTSSGNGATVFTREFSPGLFGFWNGFAVSNPLSSAFFSRSSSSRRHTPVKSLIENLTWSKGRHALNFGFTFTRVGSFTQAVSRHTVPGINLGIAANDPVNTGATSIFTTTNFPGSTPAQRSSAANLYALLTGRISLTTKTASLDENTHKFEFVPTTERNHQHEYGFYVQDTWKMRPNLTINYGLRWEIQPSPVNDNRIYTRTGEEGIWGVSGVGNLFKSGTFNGVIPQFRLLNEGEQAYPTNFKDFAPTFGFAWTPNVEGGWLGRLLGGGGQTVLRGGYSIAYTREGFSAFNSMFGSNEGPSVSLGANPGNFPVEFGQPGSRWYRDGTYPFLPLPEPKFPLTARQGASLNDFDPNIRPGYVQSWSFGIQRELTKDMALEVRYVANHGTRLWRQFELSDVDIFNNGFLNEFKIAQENLRIARAANPNSNNFSNQGLPGQKSIPIIATALGQSSLSDVGFATTISRGEAGRLGSNIATNVTRMNNLINAKLVPSVALKDPNDPSRTITLSNFFVVNPTSPGNSFIMSNGAGSTYNAMQIELRRRFSQGLLAQGSYVWSKSLSNTFANSSAAFEQPTTLLDFEYDKGPAPRDIRHGFKVDWIHELPVGRGRRFLNGGNNFFAKFLEGWQWGGVARIQSGSPILLNGGRLTYNNRDSGVILYNLTRKELQDLIKIRKESVCSSSGACQGVVYWLPQNIIDNTLAAFEQGGKTLRDLKTNEPYIGPPTEAGKLGHRNFLYGPWTARFDLNLVKRTYIGERTNLELRVQFLNAFNASNITIQNPGTNNAEEGIGSAFGQTRNAYRDITVSGTNDPGGRLIEFQLRLNW